MKNDVKMERFFCINGFDDPKSNQASQEPTRVMNLTVTSRSIMAAIVLRVSLSWTATFIKDREHIILSGEECSGSVSRVLDLESNGH